MQILKTVKGYTILGIPLLILSITSANAALVWDNGEGVYDGSSDDSGAWGVSGILADDFWLAEQSTVTKANLWLVTTSDASSFANNVVNIRNTDTDEVVQILPDINAPDDNIVMTDLGDFSSTYSPWSDLLGAGFALTAYQMSIDIRPDLSLAAGAYSLELSLSAEPNAYVGWLWSAGDITGAGGSECPTIDGSPCATEPPHDLGFTLEGAALKTSAVPVPAAIWLFGTALIGFIGVSRNTKVS